MARHLRAFAVATSIAAVAALTLTTGPVAGASGADWPQEGASAARRRWNRNEVTITKSNVKNLKPGWSAGVPVGDGGIGDYLSSHEAVVAGGRVYSSATASDINTGSTTTTFRASDALTGRTVWQWSFDGWTTATPAVAGGRVFLPVALPDASGMTVAYRLYAFDQAGKVLWTAPVGDDSAAVAVDGDRVAVMSASFLGHSWGLTLFAASTGRVVGRTGGGDGDVVGAAGPAFHAGRVYVAAGGQDPPPSYAVYDQAFTTAAAPVAGWKATKRTSGPATPVATSEAIYFPDKYDVIATNPSTGAVKLTIKPTAAEGHFRTPFDAAVDADRIYLGYLRASDNVRTVTAFNRFTGARVWSRAATVKAAPTVANGVLYVAEGINGVAAYNAATGAELWRKPGIANSAAPVVANGRLYVGWTASGNPDEPAPLMMFRL